MIPTSTLQQSITQQERNEDHNKRKKNPPKVFSLFHKKKKAGRESRTSFLSHPFSRPQTRISCAKDDLRLPRIDVPDVSPETGRFKRHVLNNIQEENWINPNHDIFIFLPWVNPQMIPNSTLQQRHHSARTKRRLQKKKKKKKKNPPKVVSLLPRRRRRQGGWESRTSFLSHPFSRPQTKISCAKDDLRLPRIDVPDVSPETGRFKRRD
ncbi:hypothetical protein CEXT_808891 [Caerostris extrusa]|uniref:Uncharacterized protein n=1 Tax=Caerostris extrusa TaxID=172846 RepID=A0AAV4X0A0_CAEEX|nr:hypothetical protein CEXT_808891 [Caerostris extrusa]